MREHRGLVRVGAGALALAGYGFVATGLGAYLVMHGDRCDGVPVDLQQDDRGAVVLESCDICGEPRLAPGRS